MAYSRDKRSPPPFNENVSKIMSKNKAKNTTPEQYLRKLLWSNGFRGYRLHPKNIPGKPDICFNRKRIAIFVNGCYWHRCPKCDLPLPKNNQEFWKNKFQKNTQRDLDKIRQLIKVGWRVITIWECELKKLTSEDLMWKLYTELNS